MTLCIGADVPAQTIVLTARTVIGLLGIGIAADLFLVGLGKGSRIDDLFAVPLALIELEAYPLGQIAGARTDSTSRRFRIRLTYETIDRLAIEEDVERGLVSVVFIV